MQRLEIFASEKRCEKVTSVGTTLENRALAPRPVKAVPQGLAPSQAAEYNRDSATDQLS